MHFELRSVHTREVIAIFELCSVHTRDRICGFAFESGEKRRGCVWVPCRSNMHEARRLGEPEEIFSNMCSARYYRRKWLEGHVAPPPKSQFRGQGIHTVISLHDLRDAYNWKTPLDHHLICAFQMTHRDVTWRTHVPKYCLSNDHSKCAIQMIIQITHFCSGVKTVKTWCVSLEKKLISLG